MSAQWPPPADIVAMLADVAQRYAMDCGNNDHPEDIAGAMVTAIDVAWRTVKPVGDA